MLATLQTEAACDGISYNLIRSPKRKTVSIIIRANSDVDVLAPSRMPTSIIEQFVSSKAAWIKRKLHYNNEIKASVQPKSFTKGESFLFLGEPLNLAIATGKRAVEAGDGQLLVTIPASTKIENKTDLIRRLIEKWYRAQAEVHLQQRTEQLATLIDKRPKLVAVKGYKSRWGSCHIDGRIYFNWRLIMAPTWVIDYVIVHELCHLIQHNHSKNYWSLVEAVMPDFRNAKTWLKTDGARLNL